MKKNAKIRISTLIAATLMIFSLQTAFAAGEMLVPMGCTMGILINTNGVMVSSLASTQDGQAPSPAVKAGLMAGDVITALDDEKIQNAEDFVRVSQTLTGAEIKVSYVRNGTAFETTITPNMASGKPELGLWLRDGVTGVGTMTYYDPQTNEYGGLGHGICDSESGAQIPLGNGSIFSSTIVEIIKGAAGQPGQLHGLFDVKASIGSIDSNTVVGIFGKLTKPFPSVKEAMPVASAEEIELGAATILSNVTGTAVEEYDVEITRIYQDEPSGRSLMLKITDDKLLAATGGIVQGMSGSPILQNGKIIGAVTHVTISDPTRGYGVLADNMLQAAENAA